jgi:hypothetical protein
VHAMNEEAAGLPAPEALIVRRGVLARSGVRGADGSARTGDDTLGSSRADGAEIDPRQHRGDATDLGALPGRSGTHGDKVPCAAPMDGMRQNLDCPCVFDTTHRHTQIGRKKIGKNSAHKILTKFSMFSSIFSVLCCGSYKIHIHERYHK